MEPPMAGWKDGSVKGPVVENQRSKEVALVTSLPLIDLLDGKAKHCVHWLLLRNMRIVFVRSPLPESRALDVGRPLKAQPLLKLAR